MECVIFTGIPASGKSTFYKERFFGSHIRINLDMLKTRRREAILLSACLEMKQSFVVDNTNPTAISRARYIGPAKEARFRIIGYYFHSKLTDAQLRNNGREGSECIPDAAVSAIHQRLEPPAIAEGYDEMFVVTIRPNNQFSVKPITPLRSSTPL
jgi:tRNA uridine 5-carbamoylmethylation protein Kti12